MLVEAHGGRIMPISAGPNTFTTPSLSLDGKTMAVAARTATSVMYDVALDGAYAKRLYSTNLPDGDLQWMPNGTSFTYLLGGNSAAGNLVQKPHAWVRPAHSDTSRGGRIG